VETADGIAGPKFAAAVNSYQKNVLGYSNPDGEIIKKLPKRSPLP